ncbi:MAG: (Fe-S)-binding protein [Armatimonadetes bacterium]|nr:(Fe-S)-binding protein [Armatimonadota bacterium]
MKESELEELTTKCIRCGFCLEACPTFKITGEESESPRGRITMIRSATEGKLTWNDAKPHLDSCLGCVACMTACPSGVQYGTIIENARAKLQPEKAKHVFIDALTNPTSLKLQLGLSRFFPGGRMPKVLSRILSGQSPEADTPRPMPVAQRPPLDEGQLMPIKGEVALLTGCIMGVLYADVHDATRRLLRRVGFRVIDLPQKCCGALHAHSGFLEDASDRLADLKTMIPAAMPLITNSAGCGSHLKHAQLTETRDASEFLFEHGLRELLQTSTGLAARISYHDACHLAHGQGITNAPRELLKAIPRATFAELNEADTCCGSAGIYNITEPKMARKLLNRKMENVLETEASILATGNPGCHAWIEQGCRESSTEMRVLHTMQVLEAAFD